jgi:UDP-N-acetylglucosamine transferase subunit ALG13
MIFVTTGTQLAFDRLIKAVESWAKKNQGIERIFAQTCQSDPSLHHIEAKDFLSPTEYAATINETTLLIGHAGTGTIITAHEYALPLIIMPRKFALGEHRNDHQIATVAKFKDTPGVYVANNEAELHVLLDRRYQLKKCGEYQPANRTSLINFLKHEVQS